MISSADTRWELAEQRGRRFEARCGACNRVHTISVDDVYAIEGRLPFIALIVIICIGIAGILFLLPMVINRGAWDSVKAIAGTITIPALIYFTVVGTYRRKINLFNSSRPDSLRS